MDCSPPGSSVHGILQAGTWSGLPFPTPGVSHHCRSSIAEHLWIPKEQHIYKRTHTYIYIYIYIYIRVLFHFFAIMIYHGMLNIVPCAMKYNLVVLRFLDDVPWYRFMCWKLSGHFKSWNLRPLFWNIFPKLFISFFPAHCFHSFFLELLFNIWALWTGPLSSVQSLSRVWLLCDPMNYSTPGLPVYHHLPECTQIHVHWVGDAI